MSGRERWREGSREQGVGAARGGEMDASASIRTRAPPLTLFARFRRPQFTWAQVDVAAGYLLRPISRPLSRHPHAQCYRLNPLPASSALRLQDVRVHQLLRPPAAARHQVLDLHAPRQRSVLGERDGAHVRGEGASGRRAVYAAKGSNCCSAAVGGATCRSFIKVGRLPRIQQGTGPCSAGEQLSICHQWLLLVSCSW